MEKAIALPRAICAISAQHQREIARMVIVLACAAALILAGQPLPFWL